MSWSVPPGETTKDKSALEQAQEFLRALLAQGPVLSQEIQAAADPAGFAWATLKRAKPLCGIRARKRSGAGKDAPWEWYLPAPPPTGSSPLPMGDEPVETVVESQEKQGDTNDGQLAHGHQVSQLSDEKTSQGNQWDRTSVSTGSSPLDRDDAPVEEPGEVLDIPPGRFTFATPARQEGGTP
jgi:hypothetical protein